VITACIEAPQDRFGVEPNCPVLCEGCTIAPSTYHARRKTPVSSAERSADRT
jgi:hypothetical protein